MKLFITGVSGQLGHDVSLEAAARGYSVTGSDLQEEEKVNGWNEVKEAFGAGKCGGRLSYASLDITDEASCLKVIGEAEPDAVVHCAAWTAVDAAEDEDRRETVFKVNELGAGNVAKAASAAGAKVIYLSTDYVFDGKGETPWEPDCRDFAPLNVYGESKLAGEKMVVSATDRYFIVRIAWVFGKNGNNFVRTMLRLSETHDSLRVVSDQIGTPTYTPDLSRLLVDMAETDRYGFYHATNEGGFISWYDFACEIFRQAGKKVNVTPVTTDEYGLSKAARPFNSRLGKDKLVKSGFKALPDWKDALARYLSENA